MILPPTIKENMTSFIVNNGIQGEHRFVYEPVNTADTTTPTCIGVKVPFPPPINVEDLIVLKKNGDIPSRSPNAFLIYRRVYVEELKAQNKLYKMTDVSSLASASWKNEPEKVKQEYSRIAGEAKNMLTTTRHKSLTFSRRKQNNSNKNNNTRTPKAKASFTPQSPRKKQQISQSSTQELNQYQPLNISQPIIDNNEPFSPSFEDAMENLLVMEGHESFWPNLDYPDSEFSTSTNGIDLIIDQPLFYSSIIVNNELEMFNNQLFLSHL
jgi:hypothetical protein